MMLTTEAPRGVADVVPACCPNCESQAPLDYVLSIGCIVRTVHRRDAEQHRLLSKELPVELHLSDLPSQFFADKKSHWTELPRLIQALRYDYENLHLQKALMTKEIRVCSDCYFLFADEVEEMRVREKSLAVKPPTVPLQPPPYQAPTRMASYFYPPKNSDRAKDMAFTDLQAVQRKSEVMRQVKRDVRDKFVLDNLQKVDWGSSEMAARQVTRITSAASSRAPLTEGDLVASPRKLLMSIEKSDTSPERSGGAAQSTVSAMATSVPPSRALQVAAYGATPHQMVHIHCSRPNTAGTAAVVVPPLPRPTAEELEPELANAEPSMATTAFDVLFHERLMFELWDSMRRECKFGASDEFLTAIPKASDPMFPVYRRNQYRFPTPPVLAISLAPPSPVSSAEPTSEDLDVVHRLDSYFPPHLRQLANQCATSQVGLLLDLDADETAMLAEVMANDDIKMALGSDLDDDEPISVDEDEDDEGEYYGNFDQ